MKKIYTLLIIFLFFTFYYSPVSAQTVQDMAQEHFELGMHHFESDAFTTAADEFETAIKYYPDYIKAHEQLVLCIQKYPLLWDEVIKFYDQQIGIKWNPLSTDAAGLYFGLGYCYVKVPGKENKEKQIEYFNKSLKIENKGEIAERIGKIAKHLNITGSLNFKGPTWKEITTKTGGISILVIIVLIMIGPVRSFIKSKQPQFVGRIFLVNPDGDKIEDEALGKFKRYNRTTITIGSDMGNGIVVPTSEKIHAYLKPEKMVYQNRINFAIHEGAKVFLVAAEKDKHGVATGVTYTVPFHGGLLYDRDVLKIGDYRLQYIYSLTPQRPQEEILKMIPALTQATMAQEKREEPPAKPSAPKLLSREIASAKKIAEENSEENFPGKAEELKEKILTRREEGEKEEEVEDMGVPAFSGAVLFSQDKESQIQDAIAKAKARLQSLKEKEAEVEEVEDEDEYEQYISIMGVNTVEADKMMKTKEDYEEEYDDEDYEEEKIIAPPGITEEISLSRLTEVKEKPSVLKIDKENIQEAIKKVKNRIKSREEEAFAIGTGDEEEEALAIGTGDEEEEEEVKEIKKGTGIKKKEENIKKIKIAIKSPPKGPGEIAEKIGDKSNIKKVKKIIKKKPLPVSNTEKAVPPDKILKKKIKKKKVLVKSSQKDIEDKVKAIEEKASKSLEDRFNKISVDKKTILKKKKIKKKKVVN